MYITNIQPESEVRGSLLLINPEPKGWGVYQWQTSDDWGQGLYIVIYTVMAIVHMIYTMIKSYLCICINIHLGIPLMYAFIIVCIYIYDICISYNTGTRALPDIYARRPAPEGKCVYIRQSTSACVITNVTLLAL